VALPRASQPFGIVVSPTDGSVFVALEATGQVLKLNGSTGAQTASLAVGPNPRHLALTPAGDKLLVSRFITRPLPGEGTATVSTTDANGNLLGGEVLLVNPQAMTLTSTMVLRHSEKADVENQGRGIPNYLGAAAISPDGKSAWVPSKQDNIKRGSLRDGNPLNFQSTVRAITSRLDLATGAEDYPARVDHDNAGIPSAARYHPSGAYVFVALETNRQVAVIDPVAKVQLFRIEVGLAPQGLAFSADGSKLYVNNFMSRSVSVVDLGNLVNFGQPVAGVAATLSSVASDVLPAAVLKGKQLFYDARDTRLARDSYMSCASCHNDAGHDGRTWDFTNLGEGLRNTTALKGRAGTGQGFMHWSANFDEVQDFEGQIRNFAGGTGLMTDAQFNTGTVSQPLGARKTGLSADLDALAAYLGSLTSFAPGPWRNADGTLSSAASAGKTVFNASCISCHGGATFTLSGDATQTRNIGTVKPTSGNRLGVPLTGIDIPTLRDAWATAPYLHDGSAATLPAAISAHNNLTLSANDVANVAAYVQQIGSEEPAAPLPAAAGTGLSASYFNGTALAGPPLLQRTEAVNFNWGVGSPAANVPVDNFSARWIGSLTATLSGPTQLQILSDDGVRVWVGGVLVIDNWTLHGPTADTATINLTAGVPVPITVEYFEATGGATMALSWQPPGATAFSPVPPSALTPAFNLAQGQPATQSSTVVGGLAGRAVDGNTDGNWNNNSVTHSDLEAQPWWQVDVGRLRNIQAVQLWNRTDCCADRLSNAYVLVSPADMTGRTLAQLLADPRITQVPVASLNGAASLVLPTNGAVGRYVRVQLMGTSNLSLAEVQVLGR
jgi:DNA-binding beta-propeller fold protein YncE/mono/diheme cytochrome c family protein